MKIPDIFSFDEAALYRNMTPEAFRYHVSKGRGPDFFLKGRTRLYTRDALDKWVKEDKRSENGNHLKHNGKYE